MTTSTHTNGSTQTCERIIDIAGMLELVQPEAALGLYTSLSGEDFGYAHRAQAQRATIMWRLGQFDEATQIFEGLIDSLSSPEQSFARGTYIVRMVELVFTRPDWAKDTSRLDSYESLLDEAEMAFKQNDQPVWVGKVSNLKAVISLARKDHDKALEQAERGLRIITSHKDAGATEASILSPASSTPAFAGSLN